MYVLPDNEFGFLLRRYRTEAGLSQEALAEKAALTAQAVSALERGVHRAPQRQTVELLTSALRLNLGERQSLEATIVRRRAPRGDDAPRGVASLDAPLSRLIGRDREVAQILTLLRSDDVRLLTLVGTGGVGKTRVALQVAKAACDYFPGGAHVVSLAPIRDVLLVEPAIARALGVRPRGTGRSPDVLASYLRGKKLLLILDNFEYLLAAAPLLVELLGAHPQLRLLVTSRAPLRVRGERQFAIDTLPVPALVPPPTATELASLPSVALFIDCAKNVSFDFELTAANGDAVAEICRRLDGLPLALELAASRIGTLPPRMLQAKLQRRLKILVGGARDLPARQQTLRRTIDWSHELLAAEPQQLFRRLSAFVGGCDLAAVEHVCASLGDRLDPLEALTALHDHHLCISAATPDGGSRETMLETIREYATERLVESGESHAVRRAHASYYGELAERAEPWLVGPEQALWLRRLELDHDNLREALRWSLDSGTLEVATRIVLGVWRFWWRRDHLREGREWVDAVLAKMPADEALDGDRARALFAGAVLADRQDDFVRATALLESARAIFERLGDARGVASALNGLGLAARSRGDYDRAAALHEESLRLRRSDGNERDIALSLNNLGVVALDRGDVRRAYDLLSESLAASRRGDDASSAALALSNLGVLARRTARYDDAVRYHEEGLALRRELGDAWGIVTSLNWLGDVARDQGAADSAARYYAESLRRNATLGIAASLAESFEGLALVAGRTSCDARSVHLVARAEVLREAIGVPKPPAEVPAVQRLIDALQESLGSEEFTRARTSGREGSLECAIDEALAIAEELTSRPERHSVDMEERALEIGKQPCVHGLNARIVRSVEGRHV